MAATQTMCNSLLCPTVIRASQLHVPTNESHPQRYRRTPSEIDARITLRWDDGNNDTQALCTIEPAPIYSRPLRTFAHMHLRPHPYPHLVSLTPIHSPGPFKFACWFVFAAAGHALRHTGTTCFLHADTISAQQQPLHADLATLLISIRRYQGRSMPCTSTFKTSVFDCMGFCTVHSTYIYLITLTCAMERADIPTSTFNPGRRRDHLLQMHRSSRLVHALRERSILCGVLQRGVTTGFQIADVKMIIRITLFAISRFVDFGF
ncbi:hypothetical protein C8R43DRAFT_968840 [Mycena crocata]|nr:hypothetical protein C8R43DRAFT_968840 [Mycena crocata]